MRWSLCDRSLVNDRWSVADCGPWTNIHRMMHMMSILVVFLRAWELSLLALVSLLLGSNLRRRAWIEMLCCWSQLLLLGWLSILRNVISEMLRVFRNRSRLVHRLLELRLRTTRVVVVRSLLEHMMILRLLRSMQSLWRITDN